MNINTKKRTISAFVMLGLLAFFLTMGKKAFLTFILLLAMIIVDEVCCNFLNKKRFSLPYFLSQFLLLFPFFYFIFFSSSYQINMAVSLSVIVNLSMILYLFYQKDSSLFVRLAQKYSPFVGIYILLPFVALGSITSYEDWREFLILLIVVNYGMDTGAWFFGRKLGKHKLWPKVSPNKTIEGVAGGVLTSVVIGGFTYFICFNHLQWNILLFFALLGVVSQVGDLVQSKLKRQFHIKDSSTLIPGHGGVYDRLDSLIFLAPFTAAILSFYSPS